MNATDSERIGAADGGRPGQENRLARLLSDPIRLIVFAFAAKIIIGTWLLSLAAVPGRPIAAIDLLFISTSAVCVTGLISIDTATSFTPIGQGVIALLIQVGGVGIMTLWLFVLSSRGLLTGRAHHLATSVVGETSVRRIGRILLSVLITTAAVETVGALVLFSRAITFRPDLPSSIGWAVFHSISAFCNAGFSLQSDNLVSFAGDGVVTGTIMFLIIIGGLGYGVIAEFIRRDRPFLSLHTQLVIAMTLILIVGSVPFLAALEWNGTVFNGASVVYKIWHALFLSVTSRTAGFNTVDTTLLRGATMAFIIGLMLVGASPGGTGGGFKTTVLAIILLRARSLIQGTRYVRFGRWEIGESLVAQAVWIMLIYLLTAGFLSLCLLVTETGMPAEDNPNRTMGLVFETVSALGTVGLSTGVTPLLSTAGKIIIIIAMFIGRVGPITFFLSIGGKPRRSPVKLIDENVGLG